MWVKPSRYLSTTQPLTYPLLPLSGIGDEEWNRKRKKQNQLGFNIKAVLRSGTREKENKKRDAEAATHHLPWADQCPAKL